jgi:hypothetical protein
LVESRESAVEVALVSWRAKLDVVMRQVHRAGEKAFIDYSGKRPWIIDAATAYASGRPRQ